MKIYNRRKNKKVRLRDDAFTFATTTSLHALPFFIRSKSYSGRIFWVSNFYFNISWYFNVIFIMKDNYLFDWKWGYDLAFATSHKKLFRL